MVIEMDKQLAFDGSGYSKAGCCLTAVVVSFVVGRYLK